MLNAFNDNLDEVGTTVGVFCAEGIVGNVQIAFPNTNFMGTTLLLSCLTAGDVHHHLRFCFLLFISRMPIWAVENYFNYGYYRRDSLTKIVV